MAELVQKMTKNHTEKPKTTKKYQQKLVSHKISYKKTRRTSKKFKKTSHSYLIPDIFNFLYAKEKCSKGRFYERFETNN
jgi:hypothetical protein